MIVAGHQPNYLPYLGYFHKIASVDRFMIVDTVQFVKRGTFGWIHRNKIRTNDGWQWLSLPVKTKGRRDQTCADAELQNQTDWRRKHWSAIEFHYKSAPYFQEFAEPYREIYESEWSRLAPLSAALIRTVAKQLNIETPIELASEHAVEGHAHELLQRICNHYEVSRYLSGQHGFDYLDLDEMADRGVKIEFQEFTHPIYPQCQPGDFLPYMSAIDAIFNLGPAAGKILLESSAGSS